MLDWTQAEEQLRHLDITEKEGFVLTLFPPKKRREDEVCVHFLVNNDLDRSAVEQKLDSLPGYGFGYIPNWGGTKNAEISYCRALFYEDDNPDTGLEHKKRSGRAPASPTPHCRYGQAASPFTTTGFLRNPAPASSGSKRKSSSSAT